MDNPAFRDQAPKVDTKSDESNAENDKSDKVISNSDLQYAVDDVPPWHTCIILGFQHYMMMFGGTIVLPHILAGPLCMEKDDVAKADMLSTIIFVSGIVTLLQTTFGTRLPIVQGGTFAFIAPTFALMSLPEWKCPDMDKILQDFQNASNSTNGTQIDWSIIWQPRMREIQGAITVASISQIIIGFTGLVGFLLRFIGPLAIAPTICLVGLSLFDAAYQFCEKQWWIALLTVALITLFSQYLRNISIPCIYFNCKEKACSTSKFPIFTLFPIIISLVAVWWLCFMLTIFDVFPNNPGKYGYEARTDVRSSVISGTAWFRVPYPGQWGLPTVSTAGVFGMLAGVIASMIESIGDYYACARLAGAKPPPIHAINRGIGIEGIGCVLAGLFGTGNGTTSYSENIGAIGITKVGSRRVIQVGGIIMLVCGIFGKFGALFVSIPDPVIGGMFIALFGMIAAVGLSNLQFIDMNSPRNLYILGLALMFGIAVPEWMKKVTDPINTGSRILNQIIIVLLSTPMFVGMFVGFFLDNTIPGTLEERGILKWREQVDENTCEADTEKKSCYDLPFGMTIIRKWKWTRYIPFCPTFSTSNFNCTPCKNSDKIIKNEDDNSAINIEETYL